MRAVPAGPAAAALAEAAAGGGPRLQGVLGDAQRAAKLRAGLPGPAGGPGGVLDYSRQKVTPEVMATLFDYAREADLEEKVAAMFRGEAINATEGRPVLHCALRAAPGSSVVVDGVDVVAEVQAVLGKIKAFSEKVRSGEWKGATGKPLKDVVAIGIGGSYLGPLFVHTALQTSTGCVAREGAGGYTPCVAAAAGRRLRFLANVDPVNVATALDGLAAESTLVVVISKTFTTRETLMNAHSVRSWIVRELGEGAVKAHMAAVSSNVRNAEAFGIDPANVFPMWDWVGGRFSVSSAVGAVPLSLQYGFDNFAAFLEGARAVDEHFATAKLEENVPAIMGLLSVWNVSFLGYPARAVLPYSEALALFPAHLQQLSMESNGKGVDMAGHALPAATGEIDFGAAGTNGQHSFYQLIHQGRVVPCDFIGAVKSQQNVHLANDTVSNHDELMCNFFAQPDALAFGKGPDELRAEGVPEELIAHKTFSGDRPSLSLLLPAVDPYTVGQLNALYEHRIAVQGFMWGINSFDQWGVELGKVLAKRVKRTLEEARASGQPVAGVNPSTDHLLNLYLAGSAGSAEGPDALGLLEKKPEGGK